jgi:hypothetical protein
MGQTQTILLLVAAVALAITLWFTIRLILRRWMRRVSWVPDVMENRFVNHPANDKVLRGIRSLLREGQIDPLTPLSELTPIDRRNMKNTIGQLYAPPEEFYPLLKKPLPLPC